MHHEYNEHHDLVHTWDSDGRETLYTYDQEHNPVRTMEKIKEGKWKETARKYDFRGRCILERDALGNESLKEYEANRAYPSRVITPKGEETAYGYDTVGRRLSISNTYGTVELAYNSRNFVTSRIDGEGYTTRRFYDRMGNLTTYYPPVQWEKKESGYEYRHDFLERVVDTISPLQEHHRVFRNFDGDITSRIHPVSYALKGEEGEGTRYEYNSDGNCIRILYPDGGVERRFYDADGNMIKQVQPESYDADSDDGNGYRYAYDACGRMTEVQDPGGNILHTYEYNGHGQILREVDGEGKEVLYTYNDLGWKIREQIKVQETDPALYRVIAYTYDSQGNKVEEAYGQQEVERDGEPDGWHRIHFSYDKNNHLNVVKDDFGAKMRYDYDCLGNVTLEERAIADGVHSVIHYAYNKNGWLVQRTEEIQGNGPVQAAVTRYAYDANGNLTKITTPKGFEIHRSYDADDRLTGERVLDRKNGIDRRVQYRYNSLGKISERIDQLGFTETFRYDEEGNLSLHIDRDGRQLQRACNVFGQPVYEKASDAEGKHTNISTWHYDSLGRVTRAVCDGKSYEYIYDAHGNLKEKRSNGKSLVSYTHDRAGQITEIRDPEGVCTRYEYDILGRRSRIFNDDGLEVRYGYDALNRISRIHYGNGVETAYTYDGDGNVRTLETKAGENVLLSFAYRYDGNGNRTAKTGMQAGVTLGGVTSEITAGNNALDLSYNYDVRGQLLEERRNGTSVCYAYDKAGNRIRKTDAQGEIRYLYNEKNQLIAEESPVDRKQFSYDRQGGIIEEKNAAGIRLFSYNSRHQQTRVETETGSVQENRYDAEGLRFELLENGRRTSFVYHDGELLQEEGREEQGTSYHLGAGMEAFRRGQELSYYHRDEQLSTVFVTDGQGEIRNSYQYDAFGIPLETTEQLNNRIRYTGQQYDELTEQYYLRARYYNPVAGRFMQEDVYQGDGLNLYAYCGNNPVVYDDPSGYARKACPPKGKISESVDGSGSNTTATERRNSPGVVEGNGRNTSKMMYGTDKNAGVIPKEIADKLREKQYNNFDEFRNDFWKAVAETDYANEFLINGDPKNYYRMKNGGAPLVVSNQAINGSFTYQLHHIIPINQGGSVYSVDNLVVVTPRYHAEILIPEVHGYNGFKQFFR